MKVRSKGFTLIELLVVIAIIGVLSAVVLASLSSSRVKARNASYNSLMREYEKALELYYSDHGSYPVTSGWACIGLGQDDGACWPNTYVESSPQSTAFRAALSPYINSTAIPGPTTGTYNAMYSSLTSGSGYQITFVIEGNTTCSKGTTVGVLSSGSLTVTRCLITR